MFHGNLARSRYLPLTKNTALLSFLTFLGGALLAQAAPLLDFFLAVHCRVKQIIPKKQPGNDSFAAPGLLLFQGRFAEAH